MGRSKSKNKKILPTLTNKKNWYVQICTKTISYEIGNLGKIDEAFPDPDGEIVLDGYEYGKGETCIYFYIKPNEDNIKQIDQLIKKINKNNKEKIKANFKIVNKKIIWKKQYKMKTK